ncbi:hypothetical protein CC86DRAFT_370743 [Ophiobolus disseminans]|uniref:Uncharacterized protein n=1 Tax=Ophiobolus disseminans TaxID=1469910 RepID=A0A6A6ZZD0_9PLEO|nr:hypothetical protein CC86DRAFT_370743 [Ophiobolus disseminans]
MGIPYSRQINAAFEQVTPLVAAGFKVLRTTRDISILLAVIQVLTVFFLFLILLALIAVLYCVNPDLEYERKYLVTPWLKTIAHITVWGIVKSVVWTGIVLAGTGWAVWKLFIMKQWVEDVEYEGNVDANEALENLEEGKKEKDGKDGEKEKEEKDKKNGKGKKK